MSKHSFRSWVMATRPWAFPASATPVAVTLAYMFFERGAVNWGIGLWALATIVLFHAAGNTWSDYFDFKKGVDRGEDNVGGTSLTSGEFVPSEIMKLSSVLLLAAVVSGVLLVVQTGVTTLYFGLAGVALTLLYPAMKYRALGDLDIFLTYSLLPILATTYVATGELCYSALWLTLPLGLITVAILHINNTRDMESDREAGIRTLAMMAGKRYAAYIYCVEIFLPFVWVIGLAVGGVLPLWALIVALALMPAVKAAGKALRFPTEGRSVIIGLDEATAQLQLVFSLLIVVSCIIGGLM